MTVTLTHPDKVLWPEPGVTKAELATYYQVVADRMLPHVAGRPITLLRHNSGVQAPGFLQKNLPDSAPDFVGRFSIWTPSSQREVAYALADEVDDLVWMANQNAVEIHPWFSRVDRPDRPDFMAFDLDPSDPSQEVWRATLWLRDVLTDLGLESAVKTSGKRGIHVYVPIERRYGFDEVRATGLAVARACVARHPDALTVQMRKAERDGKLLLDWSRNGAAQTLVAAWSTRAHRAATVSTPLDWDEVGPDLRPAALTVRTVVDRPDPWATIPPPQRLERARRTLEAEGIPVADESPRARTK